MIIHPPCEGCDKRYIGCHGQCEQYKAYKVKVDEQREAKRNKANIDKAIRDNKHKTYDDMKKRGFL